MGLAMKDTITSLFNQYKQNFSEWEELEKQLMKAQEREVWFEDFYKTMDRFQLIYDSNKDIIAKLSKILDALNDETAEEILNSMLEMYFEHCKDPEFLTFVCDKLIEFYEDRKDNIKLINLYSVRNNCNILVGNPEGLRSKFDYSDNIKIMAYLDRYQEFDEEIRYRIWVAYYNYIARLTDMGVVNISDALDKYDEIISVTSTPEIQKLDADSKRITNISGYLNQSMFTCIAFIDEASLDERKRFYQYVKRFFDNNKIELKSFYELPAELYACHIFVEYMEGKYSLDDTFGKLVDYIAYKSRLLQSKGELCQEEAIQSINVLRFLSNLGKHVSDRKMVTDAISKVVEFVQTTLVKSNLVFYEKMSYLFGKLCTSLLAFDVVGFNKEKCITQLIVQRDIHVYIESKVTTDIAMALYREMTANDLSFFDEVKSIPSSEWKNYLYYASMFHDIGMEQIFGTVVFRSRPKFEKEKKRHRNHTIYGSSVMEQYESTYKYAVAMKGHHTYFNGENNSQYEYDRAGTDLNAFVDILSLASYIATKTDCFWNFEKTNNNFRNLLQNIKAASNTRFNGRIVDALLSNEVLQKEIENIVTVSRRDIVYDVYHNWEKIQLSQDEESMLADCNVKYEEFRKSMDTEAFEPYFKQLEYLAGNAANEEISHHALYKVMLYTLAIGKYDEGLGYVSELERYIKKSRNYEWLVEFYFYIGNAESVCGNIDDSLLHLMSSIWYSSKAPGSENYVTISNLNIAVIFSTKFNYSKSKEYFDKCNIEYLRPDEQLQYLCMRGYCCVKLGLVEDISLVRDEIVKLVSEDKSLIIYPLNIYLAIFAAKIGDDVGFEKALAEMAKQEITSDEVKFFSEEMFMYIELLETQGKHKEASDIIDKYLELCEGKKEYSEILTKLINIKIEGIAHQKGYKDIIEYETKLRNAFYDSLAEEANRIEDIETSLFEKIKLRAEHDEILSNKAVLEESVKRAQSDSESKSQFLSSMSHEIRTPINAIIGFNEMIMRESKEEQIQQYASNIDGAGRQLLGIINDILDYSKIEAGKMVIVSQNYKIGALINDIVSMIKPKAIEKNLEFIVNYNKEIPNELLGDDLRIKQILLNLLSNAYKYTNEGKITFNIDFSKIDEQSVELNFEVIDTGIGLKEDQIKKIANPFERFELTSNRSVEGTGLGMNIVTRLLAQMDSHLDIESEFGVGSKFSFAIKQSVVEWSRTTEFLEHRMSMLSTANYVNTAKGKSLNAPNAKVLVVDDNAVNLKVASALLKRTNIQITCAASGEECLSLCEQNEYNIILLDHMMPKMDGIETLEKLKASNGCNSSTPVVALTANVVESADDFYIKAGFDALLTKPINADKMEEVLSSLLPDYLLE